MKRRAFKRHSLSPNEAVIQGWVPSAREKWGCVSQRRPPSHFEANCQAVIRVSAARFQWWCA
eukprot:5309586-Amphidinium_carterae.1